MARKRGIVVGAQKSKNENERRHIAGPDGAGKEKKQLQHVKFC